MDPWPGTRPGMAPIPGLRRLMASHGPNTTLSAPYRPPRRSKDAGRQQRRGRGRHALSFLTCGLRSDPNCGGEHSMCPGPVHINPNIILPQSIAPRILHGRPDKSRGQSFLDLPAELRNKIYDFSLYWPTSRELYAPYNRIIDAHYARLRSGIEEDFPKYHRRFKTPTILLLCRQITDECRPMLRSRQFIIDRLPPWLPGAPRPMDLSEFIGQRTLQNLEHIEIRLPLGQGSTGSGWAWVKIFEDIFYILQARNQFKDLRVVISMLDFRNRLVWDSELEHLRGLRSMVSNPPIPARCSLDVAWLTIVGV